MKALFDTGSSNTWVAGANLKSPKIKRFHNYFNGTESTTFVRTNETYHINFGSGSLDGLIVRDDIRLGNIDNSTAGKNILI